jgi:hypothetical protein
MSKKQSRTLIWTFCAILFLALSSCWLVKPAVAPPVYDVLKPGPEVQILAINLDQTVLVSADFMVWVKMLKQEIKRLREKTGEVW